MADPTDAGEPVSAEMAGLLDRCGTTCRLLAEQEEGPYRRGAQPRRRDVTEARDGSPLRLGLRLRSPGGHAVSGAEVEIWHCDAEGRYSGYPPSDPSVAVRSAPQRAEYLLEETFLRGRQTTDAAGDVEFRSRGRGAEGVLGRVHGPHPAEAILQPGGQRLARVVRAQEPGVTTAGRQLAGDEDGPEGGFEIVAVVGVPEAGHS